MSRSTLFTLAFVSAAHLAGCAGKKEKKANTRLVVDDHPSETLLVGVNPEDFKCESVFALDKATAFFGGRVEQVEPMQSPPPGVPKACNYVSHAAGRDPIRWSFDLDCRDGALKQAGKLMTQYADAPSAAPVLVGHSGLDHNDSALLFIDDDTPCYGRVLGPDKEVRAMLGKHLVQTVTPHSAPTGAHLAAQK